ncbi:MAG: crossover junction endodeoxyribonuclease RuvC [Candidatus Staskawiczbacteria bacterium]|nr:crossover junction endodeoxyribonuclease RuvC [Candidatus Staskawiczbacteria bacterium]
MIILGIDPGTATTGYGVIKKQRDQNQKFKVLDFGCIITEQTSLAGERLYKIHKEILKLIDKHKPDLISVESLFFFKNLKTVMPVSQAKGVILLAAAQKKIPTCEFTPLQVKMTIVGYGRAEKKQVQKMTKEILDLSKFDLKKNNRNKDDAADALGIAICAGLKDLRY